MSRQLPQRDRVHIRRQGAQGRQTTQATQDHKVYLPISWLYVNFLSGVL